MEHDQAMQAVHAGRLVEAVVMPAEEADGWHLWLAASDGAREAYTSHGGTATVFHTLDHATEVARELGFESIRVEETF
jgi:hypothetical protein